MSYFDILADIILTTMKDRLYRCDILFEIDNIMPSTTITRIRICDPRYSVKVRAGIGMAETAEELFKLKYSMFLLGLGIPVDDPYAAFLIYSLGEYGKAAHLVLYDNTDTTYTSNTDWLKNKICSAYGLKKDSMNTRDVLYKDLAYPDMLYRDRFIFENFYPIWKEFVKRKDKTILPYLED